jgi:hypothetical protein
MFRIGEKIVYMGTCDYYSSLINFMTYTINDYQLDYTLTDAGEYLLSLSEKSEGNLYYSNFFITLTEYRKLKLTQLCSE